MVRLAFLITIATGCASSRRPPPESIPNDYVHLSFRLDDGSVVVLQSWRLDERADAFDGVGTWYRRYGYPPISGRLRVPMRVVAHVETVRNDEPPDHRLENAIVALLQAGILATEIAVGCACDCD